MNTLHRLKLQQKFKSFKQRHNNVFRKGFRGQAQNLRGSSSRFRGSSSSRHSEDTEPEEEGEGEGGEGKRYGKRIDLIRNSAANRLIGEVVQSRRRPLLGPSPG